MYVTRTAVQEEMEAIFRLRYQVYCIEKGYLPNNYPDGIEKDEYDDYSTHFVAIDGQYYKNKIVGYFRAILKRPDFILPIEKHFNLFTITPDPAKTVEHSRLIVSKEYRDVRHQIMLSLVKAAYLYNKSQGIEFCYAAVEWPLYKFLRRLGLPYEMAGRENFYMGAVIVPTIVLMSSAEEDIPVRNSWLYSYFNGEEIPC